MRKNVIITVLLVLLLLSLAGNLMLNRQLSQRKLFHPELGAEVFGLNSAQFFNDNRPQNSLRQLGSYTINNVQRWINGLSQPDSPYWTNLPAGQLVINEWECENGRLWTVAQGPMPRAAGKNDRIIAFFRLADDYETLTLSPSSEAK